jgi:hypothetical protein
MTQTPKQSTGETGEEIAVKHLVKHSFEIIASFAVYIQHIAEQ